MTSPACEESMLTVIVLCITHTNYFGKEGSVCKHYAQLPIFVSFDVSRITILTLCRKSCQYTGYHMCVVLYAFSVCLNSTHACVKLMAIVMLCPIMDEQLM